MSHETNTSKTGSFIYEAKQSSFHEQITLENIFFFLKKKTGKPEDTVEDIIWPVSVLPVQPLLLYPSHHPPVRLFEQPGAPISPSARRLQHLRLRRAVVTVVTMAATLAAGSGGRTWRLPRWTACRQNREREKTFCYLQLWQVSLDFLRHWAFT